MTEARPFDPNQVKRELASDATTLGFAAIGVASIEIPEEEMEAVKTVGQAVDLVATKLGGS